VSKRRRAALWLGTTLLVGLAPVAPATAQGVTPTVAGVVPATAGGATKDYIVILKDSVSVAAKVRKETALGNDVTDVFASKVKGFVAELDTADVRRLKSDAQVLIVEPDSVMSVIDTQEPTSTTDASTSSSTSTTSTSSTSTTVPTSPDDLDIGDAIPGEYIITLRAGVGAAAFAAAQADGGVEVLSSITDAINGFGARLNKSQLSSLASDPNVMLIEENTVVGIEADQANPPSWGLDRIDQRSVTRDGNYSYNFTGSGVNAYIIDTGVRSDHREFGGRVVGGNTQIGDGRGTEDCNRHGTHVAGTVGGQTVGVAKAVTIIPIRVLSCTGRGSIFSVIAGINWMIQDHTAGVPAVANLSLGGNRNTSLNSAVANAVTDGITMVVAAGNNRRDASTISPASEPSAITVGATASNDSRASFSNFGTLLDIFAPGVSIVSAGHRSSTETIMLSGTSMAAPHVAGAVALLLEENPGLSPDDVASTLASYATPDVVTDPRESVNRLLCPASDEVRATIGVPTAPSGLVATAGGAEVTLRWNAPTQNGGSAVTDYVVEFSSDGASSWNTFDDGVSTALTATVTGLTNGTTYSFRVSAANSVGVGAASGSATAVPWQVSAPSAPRDLVVTSVMATSISLEWRIPATDGGGFITGYVVEQSADDGTTWVTSLVTGTGGRAGGVWFTTVYDLSSGREYRFRVRATNSGGNSDASTPTAPQAPGIPGVPEDVRATEAGPRRIMLRWEKPASNGGSNVRGYTIEYSTDSGSSWVVWPNNTGVDGCTCQYMARTVTDLTDGVPHIFRIKAYNAVGTGPASESTDPMTPLTPTAPGQPLNVTGTAMPALVELDWDEPTSDGGAPITDYVVEYSTNAGSSWTTFADGTNTATLASLRDLTVGVDHVFRVSAVNSAGVGLPSLASSVIVPLPALANDAFGGAIPILCPDDCASGTSVRVTSSTRSATREPGEPTHGGYGASASIWYSFSIGRAGTVTIDTQGSDFDTLLGVYTGSSVNALTTVTTNDDAPGGNWSRVEVVPTVDTTYWVAIDGYGNRKGSTVLTWRFTEAPPTQKPSVPRNVRGVAGDEQIVAYWSAPESDGGAVISTYTATASPGGRACSTSGALTCAINGLTNGTAYTFTVTATNTAGTSDPSLASEPVTPRADSDDGIATLSWGLDRIDQRSLPLDARYTRTHSGAGVTAYVIDTGVRSTHSELSGRVAAGFSTISDGNGSGDCHGHGTHVAGTIAGTNYGVAPAALVVPVRVMNCSGSGSTSDIIAGIDWIINHHQSGVPAVANMSLGGPRSAALDLAVARGVADGVTFVVAAGNSNVSACTVSPAGEPLAITVGSTTSNDERSSFSNFGSCLDVFAPGSNIVSAGHASDTATRTMSGTSMAAPHVAGIAALALSQNAELSPADVASALAISATRNAVSNPGAGSLNRLVYSLLTPVPNGDDDAPTTTTTTTLVPSPGSGRGGDGGGGGGDDGGSGGDGGDDGGGGGDDGGGDNEPAPTTTVPRPTRALAPTTTVPPAVPVTTPTPTAQRRLVAPGAPGDVRPPVPAVGERPIVGTPIPELPPSTRPLVAEIRAVGKMLKVEVAAPKGALIHLYRNGQLWKSVTPDEIKKLKIPADGATAEDIQIVVVTRTGAVMSTPIDQEADEQLSAAPSAKSGAKASAKAARKAATKTSTKSGKASSTRSRNVAGRRSTDDTLKGKSRRKSQTS
jgi:subtilisin family serine protease